MSSVNKVILVARLGRDPEFKALPSGQTLCEMSVATEEQWTDKQSGERQKRTDWHTVVVWGKLAENCSKYLAKGRQVYLEGKLQTRSWDDKQSGEKRYKTEIHADHVVFLGGGEGRGGERSDADDSGRSSARGGRTQRQDLGSARKNLTGDIGSGYADDPGEMFSGDGDDDKIPF